MKLLVALGILSLATGCGAPASMKQNLKVKSYAAESSGNAASGGDSVDPSSSKQPDPSSSKTAGDQKADSEIVDIPKKVTGAYLACALVLPASAMSSSAAVACRFEDDKKNFVPKETIGKDFAFSITNPVPSNFTSTMRLLKGVERSNELILTIEGLKFAEVNSLANGLNVTASFSSQKGAESIVSQPVSTRAQTLEKTWVAVELDAARVPLDRSTGLIWATVGLNDIGWTTARNNCSSKNTAQTSWRLPTFAEAQLASEHDIVGIDSQAILGFDVSKSYWTSTGMLSNVGGQLSQLYATHNFSGGTGTGASYQGENSLLRAICVTER